MLLDALRGGFSFTDFIIYTISAIVVIFITLPVHEFAHGFIATKLGDPTPKYQGRLTLNPFAHIDYIGALMIIVAGFGWARPVQVDARNFKNAKVGMALTALAGPVSNLIVALISMLIFYTITFFTQLNGFFTYIGLLFLYVASINISLAVFNLIPIPPLDGSRLLSAFLPNRIYYKLMSFERYFFLIIMLLIFTGFLDYPLDFLYNIIFRGIEHLAALPFKLFM